jgi:cytochrome b involved in lipid metabolism
MIYLNIILRRTAGLPLEAVSVVNLGCESCEVRDFPLCNVGKVYNVTRFLKYHPGRKAQLMRGAGVDCTELFDKAPRI